MPEQTTVPPSMRTAGASLSLGDSVYEALLRDRILFLGSQVDDVIANQLAAQLLLLAAADPHRDIHLYVNSPGGSVTAGMAVYDLAGALPRADGREAGKPGGAVLPGA